MDMRLTLLLTAAAVALAAFAGWQGARPWDLRSGVRMVPWRLIMLLAGAAVFVLIIHLGALLGVPQRAF